MDIVINAGVGGFSLSRGAFLRLRELGHKGSLEEPDVGEPWPEREGLPTIVREDTGFFAYDIERNDPLLLRVVRELGERANGAAANLVIVTIPDGIAWEIAVHEDGSEHVAEQHRCWFSDGTVLVPDVGPTRCPGPTGVMAFRG
jgi:hypothetical protein